MFSNTVGEWRTPVCRNTAFIARFGAGGLTLLAGHRPQVSSHVLIVDGLPCQPRTLGVNGDVFQTHVSSSGSITIAFDRPCQPVLPNSASTCIWMS